MAGSVESTHSVDIISAKLCQRIIALGDVQQNMISYDRHMSSLEQNLERGALSDN